MYESPFPFLQYFVCVWFSLYMQLLHASALSVFKFVISPETRFSLYKHINIYILYNLSSLLINIMCVVYEWQFCASWLMSACPNVCVYVCACAYVCSTVGVCICMILGQQCWSHNWNVANGSRVFVWFYSVHSIFFLCLSSVCKMYCLFLRFLLISMFFISNQYVLWFC